MTGNPLKGSKGEREVERGPHEVESNVNREDAVDQISERSGETGSSPVRSDIQAFIGRQLRAVYDDVAKQPVPDRFLELMKQLEAKTATG